MFEDIISFFKDLIQKIKTKRKRLSPFVITVCALLVLIPTVLAVYYAYFYEDPTQLSSNNVSVSLFDSEGTLIDRDEVAFANIADSPLVNIFYGLSKEKGLSTQTELSSDKFNFSFSLRENEITTSYRCYFGNTHETSYLRDNKGVFYKVNEDIYNLFLNSKYSEPVYKSAIPPTLTTGNGDTVIPRSVKWKYLKMDGTEHTSSLFTASSEIYTYKIGGSIDLEFSSKPDDCSVVILDSSNNVVYDGDLTGLPFITVPAGTTLSASINAEWKKSEGKDTSGKLSYSFNITVGHSASFSLSDYEVVTGGITVLSGTNVDHVDSIIFSHDDLGDNDVSPLPNISPVFVSGKDNVTAIIPIDSAIAPGKYGFSVSFGATKQTFILNVTDTEYSSATVSKSSSDISDVLSEEGRNTIEQLINNTPLSDTAILYRNSFFTPADYGFKLEYSFGDSVTGLDTEGKFISVGAAYTSTHTGSTRIAAMNSGIVSAVAYNDVLGNYMVIDHGAGVLTWYCHLSSIMVEPGDILAKGDTVGQSGSSGPFSNNGVLILCSANHVLIDIAQLNKILDK